MHRDLKPENILFKTRDPVSPIVIADFGIAKHLEPDEEITSMAGSFGYAAPEVLLGKPHSYPVDLWSTGVIAYTLLCGYSPFRSDDKAELIRETTRGKVTFHDRFWKHVSEPAKDFIRKLLVVDPKQRLTAAQALQHPWIVASRGAMKEEDAARSAGYDLSSNIRENFNPRKKWSDALNVIMASNALKAAGRKKEEPLDSDSSSEEGYATADSEASPASAPATSAGAAAAGAAPAVPAAAAVQASAQAAQADVRTPSPAQSTPRTPQTPATPKPSTPGVQSERAPSRSSSGFGLAGLVNSLKAQKL